MQIALSGADLDGFLGKAGAGVVLLEIVVRANGVLEIIGGHHAGALSVRFLSMLQLRARVMQVAAAVYINSNSVCASQKGQRCSGLVLPECKAPRRRARCEPLCWGRLPECEQIL